jgi:hypothetical protein
MKNILLLAMTALMVSCGVTTNQETTVDNIASTPAETVAASGQAPSERGGYTFSTTFRKDENGQCDAIILTCQKGEKSQQFVNELIWPKDVDFLGGAGEIEEKDINFDGIPDVQLYLGNFTIDSPMEYYAAYVWDEASQSFQEVETYAGLPNPVINTEKQRIICSYYDASGAFNEEIYGWKDRTLNLIESHVEEAEEDE